MSGSPSAKEKDWRLLLEKAQGGDAKAREEMVTENMGLVYMVVQRFADRGERQDLVQLGAIGLLKAIDRFDVGAPYSFSTYAVPLIMGEIRRFLRDDGMIHTGRRLREQASKLASVRERMKKQNGREPTLRELSAETGISAEEIALSLEACRSVDSISRPVDKGDGRTMTLAEMLPDSRRFETPLLNRLALRQALTGLLPREQELIALRYISGCSQNETARRMGTNQVAVSRQEKKILQKLRRKLGE